MENLIAPHGGRLCNLLAPDPAALKKVADGLPSVSLNRRQLCDLELLINGAFSPLRGFMTRAAYTAVLERLRLCDGTVWPIPVVLDVPSPIGEKIAIGQQIALRDAEGFTVAVLTVEDIWRPDKEWEAEKVYGTHSLQHAGVRFLHEQVNDVYIGGQIVGLQVPAHHEFAELWLTPQALRERIAERGWRRVVAFHARGPLHRREYEIAMQAAHRLSAAILLHPAVGPVRPGDSTHITHIRCYRAVMSYFPADSTMLSLLPLAPRMAGSREALWHALIRQNYGCTHLIVDPAHSRPPNTDDANGFYTHLTAQAFIRKFDSVLDIEMIPVVERRYMKRQRRYPLEVDGDANETPRHISDTELRARLQRDSTVPPWFSFPEVIDALRKTWPPRAESGIVLFFTGLSGSGKSTLASIVYAKLVEHGGRAVTLLDGDVIRNLAGELGFSKKDRDLNIRRIGFVANEIAKNRGVAICAPIAPYAATRQAVRELVESHGAFIEIYVSTPLAVCEARDRKGLYAKARQGLVANFTGVSDPYEAPARPEIQIDTAVVSPVDAANKIFGYLVDEGYLV